MAVTRAQQVVGVTTKGFRKTTTASQSKASKTKVTNVAGKRKVDDDKNNDTKLLKGDRDKRTQIKSEASTTTTKAVKKPKVEPKKDGPSVKAEPNEDVINEAHIPVSSQEQEQQKQEQQQHQQYVKLEKTDKNNNNKRKADMPSNFYQTLANIQMTRQGHSAPVDSQGCATCYAPKATESDKRFQILSALIMSSQTKDPITHTASVRLQTNGCGTVEGLLKHSEKDIEDLIYPVSFYRRKAVYLKKVASILQSHYSGDIPPTLDELCKLPGVGPKMAHLCMSEAWGNVTGIGVDTHVHRIAARLNWVPQNLKSPEDTRKALESWLPRELWAEINPLLVGLGQTICLPIGRKCGECHNSSICPSAIFKDKKRKKTTTNEGPEQTETGGNKK